MASVGVADNLDSRVYTKLSQAVVEIIVDGQIKGGGTCVAADGKVVTCAHLFATPHVKIEVVHPALGRVPASLTAVSLGHDLALLTLETDKKTSTYLRLAKKRPSAGVEIWNPGHPLWNGLTVLHGRTASADTVFCRFEQWDGNVECVYVSAMTPVLTSGSSWVNAKGEVIGIQSGRLNDSDHPAGVGMIVPLKDIRKIIESEISAETPACGGWVWELWTTDKGVIESYPKGQEGLVVTKIYPDRPMAASGIKLHDLITHVNGSPVRRRPDFFRLLRAAKPGDSVSIVGLRRKGGKAFEVTLVPDCLETTWREKHAPKVEAAEPEKEPAPAVASP